MSTTLCSDGCDTLSTRNPPLSTVIPRAVAELGRLWKAWRHRTQVAPLAQLDERMLADIGLTPSDVRSALAAPFGEDPSMTLQRLAHERRVARREALRESAAELPRSTVLVSLGGARPLGRHRQR